MPAIIRYDASPPDKDTDGNFVTKPFTGSPNVFVEGLSVARKGDHLKGSGTITILDGSPSVFVNNLPVARKDDLDSDGTLTGGSPSVFADS